MASSFTIHQVVALGDRGLLAVAGELRDGMVQAGMLASLDDPIGYGGPPFRERIHGVEYLDLPGVSGLPTLTFHFRDPAKLERWLALGLEGRTLSVSL